MRARRMGERGNAVGHLDAGLRAHRRDVAGRERRNQAGDADPDTGTVHLGGLRERGLLAPEIQLVFQQQEYLGQHILHVVDGEAVAALGRREEFSQFLEQRHVLAEAFRDIWLEDLEHSLFALPSRRDSR